MKPYNTGYNTGFMERAERLSNDVVNTLKTDSGLRGIRRRVMQDNKQSSGQNFFRTVADGTSILQAGRASVNMLIWNGQAKMHLEQRQRDVFIPLLLRIKEDLTKVADKRPSHDPLENPNFPTQLIDDLLDQYIASFSHTFYKKYLRLNPQWYQVELNALILSAMTIRQKISELKYDPRPVQKFQQIESPKLKAINERIDYTISHVRKNLGQKQDSVEGQDSVEAQGTDTVAST